MDFTAHSIDPSSPLCLRCREPVSPRAERCPRCGGSLTVRLRVTIGIEDPRRVYQVARAITVGQFVPGLDFSAARDVLQHGGPLRGEPMVRDQAQRVTQALREMGVETAVEPMATSASAASSGASATPAPNGSVRPVPDVSGYVPSPAARSWVHGRGKALTATVRIAFLLALVAMAVGVVGRTVSRWGAFGAAAATNDADGEFSDDPRRIAERATAATVQVLCPWTRGAGFFVAPELLVTDRRLLCGVEATPRIVLPSGRNLSSQVVYSDDVLDLAVLRVPDAPRSPLPLGDATRVQPGDVVYVVGNPTGSDYTSFRGVVNQSESASFGVSYLRIVAGIQPESDGGPVLDGAGRVIGILFAREHEPVEQAVVLPIDYLYTHPATGVPAPEGFDREAWRGRLERVRVQRERETLATQNVLGKAVLTMAMFGPDSINATVVVFTSSSTPPSLIDILLVVESPRGACEVVASGPAWRMVPMGGLAELDSDLQRRIAHDHPSSQLAVARLRLPYDACLQDAERRRAELRIPGGLHGYDRVPVLQPNRVPPLLPRR